VPRPVAFGPQIGVSSWISSGVVTVANSSRTQYLLVDTVDLVLYNMGMMKEPTVKKRSDRNHIVYEILGPQGSYIGVTAKTESTVLKSLRSRAAKHFYRAHTENKSWLICEFLRGLTSKDEIDIRAREIIRGKAAAHARERELIRELRPYYNTDQR